jgi:hypothetical protein
MVGMVQDVVRSDWSKGGICRRWQAAGEGGEFSGGGSGGVTVFCYDIKFLTIRRAGGSLANLRSIQHKGCT